MSADDALWASLTRAAAEAGRAARSAAEHAADELSAAFGLDQQRLRWPGSDVLAGPIIPEPYSPPWERQGRRLTWHDGYMASAALSVARTLQTQELQPATVGLVAAQAALHLRPGGYRLMQVGFNSSRVLRKREWRRLVSSPLLHADLPHLAANCHTLVLEGLPLEQRLGSAGFLALVASSCALSQALVLATTRAAAQWLPGSGLADAYYISYAVGLSCVTTALKVVGGYMREADLAAARVAIPEEFVLTAGRLAAWPSVLLNQLLAPRASLTGHTCGAAAGVLLVYAARGLRWLAARLGLAPRHGRRRLQGGRLQPYCRGNALPGLLDLGGAAAHPGLGWQDVGSHVLLGTSTVLAAAWASRARAGSGG